MEKNYKEMIAKADQGDLSSQLDLAVAYFQGDINGYAELSNGIKYLEMAANGGNPGIQCLCARTLNQVGFFDMALPWYKKSAQGGNAEAQGMLAKFYFTGAVGQKDDSQALHWAQKAFGNGEYRESCLILGILCLQGNVMKTDIVYGYKMLRLSLQHGNEMAEDMVRKMESQFPQLKNL